MRYSNFMLLALVYAGWSSVAAASCFVCDEIVELDATGAACFLEKFDDFSAPLNNGEEFVEVNLGLCNDVETQDGNRGGVEVMPRLTPRVQAPIKTVFTFDSIYLTCLRELVTSIDGEIDPTVKFDLLAQCQS